MRSHREEFSKSTREQALERAAGRCECGCQLPLIGTPQYDHTIPASLGGDSSLNNCVVMSAKCHLLKTRLVDRPSIDKAKRGLEKRLGLRVKRSRPMQGSKGSLWKRKMDGTVERRS